MSQPRVVVPTAGHFHAVRFYENAESLARMVAGFAAEGFITGHPAILIATPEHRHATVQQLVTMGFNIEQLKTQGDLFILDARETLTTFMADGLPDADRFEQTMTPIIDRACR